MGDSSTSLTPKRGQTFQVKAETVENDVSDNQDEINSDFEENMFEDKLEPIVVLDRLSDDFLDSYTGDVTGDNSITLDLDRSKNEGEVLELDLSKKGRGDYSLKKNNLACAMCKQHFANQKSFFVHLKSHYVARSTKEQFWCCICKESLYSQVDYFVHLRTHYEPSVMAQLGECITGKIFFVACLNAHGRTQEFFLEVGPGGGKFLRIFHGGQWSKCFPLKMKQSNMREF